MGMQSKVKILLAVALRMVEAVLLAVCFLLVGFFRFGVFSTHFESTWKERGLDGATLQQIEETFGKPRMICQETSRIQHADGSVETVDCYTVLLFYPKNPVWRLVPRLFPCCAVRVFMDEKMSCATGMKGMLE